MKKIIIILAILLVSFCGYAQMNPVIDSLVRKSFMMKLGTSDFDKKGIHIQRGGVTYHRAEFRDSINYRNVEEREKELKAMRDACRALSKEAKESYLWESHEEGKDTLMYLLTLNNPAGRETVKLMYTDKNVTFVTLDDDGTSELQPKGWYHFEYHLENGDKPSNHYVNVAEMNQRISSILHQEGIESHDFYIRHDGSYPTSSKGMDWITTPVNYKHLPYDSETRGTLYTIPSDEQGEQVFHQLREAIAQYNKAHPHTINFAYSRNNYHGEFWQFNLFHSDYWEGAPKHEYRIVFYPPGNRRDGICRVLVEETTGDLWLPEGWQNMKSWVNGKALYYKK